MPNGLGVRIWFVGWWWYMSSKKLLIVT